MYRFIVLFPGAVAPPVLILLCVAVFFCILIRGKLNIRQFLSDIFNCCSDTPEPPPPPPPVRMVSTKAKAVFIDKSIVGKYRFVSQDNFQEYLTALDVSADKREVVMKHLSSHGYVDCQCYDEDERWYVHCDDGLRGEPSYKFHFGVPTPPLVTEDGRIVTDEFYIGEVDGVGNNSSNKMIVQKERWQDDEGNNKETTITYEFKGDNCCIMTCVHDGVSCVRRFNKEED